MQIVPLADNLHEMAKPTLEENKKKLSICPLQNLPREW